MSRLFAGIPFLFSLLTITPVSVVDTSVIDRVAASVYLIHAVHDEGRTACTGFLIAPERVLTAGHCVGESMTVAGFPATPVSVDPYYDLALLAVPVTGTPLVFRDRPVVRFEELAVLGHAYGWQRLLTLHVRVYYLDLSPGENMRPGLLVKPRFIGGMSGGPMVDHDGLVVGIVQATNADLGYGIGVTLIRGFLVGL